LPSNGFSLLDHRIKSASSATLATLMTSLAARGKISRHEKPYVQICKALADRHAALRGNIDEHQRDS
jgi:hypothetical protein